MMLVMVLYLIKSVRASSSSHSPQGGQRTGSPIDGVAATQYEARTSRGHHQSAVDRVFVMNSFGHDQGSVICNIVDY